MTIMLSKCLPAGGSLLRRALDAESAARRRQRCLRGAALNAALLLALAADLSSKCSGYTSVLHWVELAAAGVAGANLARLALRLLSCDVTPPALTPAQRSLLKLPGLRASPAPALRSDSSFPEERQMESFDDSSVSLGSDSVVPLSPRRRAAPASPPPSPPSPAAAPRTPPDRFIADRHGLAQYLQEYEEQQRLPAAGASPGSRACAAPLYQLAAWDAECAGPAPPPAAALAAAWRRLHLDPQRLTQFNLNLRLWLHVTILERLVREMASADAALARLGVGATLDELAGERLRALAGAAPAPAALAQLLPFLEPFPNRRYVVRRVRELARGGCLSEYRWSGGGAGREDADPCDAELLLHLLCAYLDSQLPAVGGAGARPFSSVHVAAAPAPVPRALAVYRAEPRPPHYVLAQHGDTLEVARGRNNLLHTLLVFLAAAARQDPPALGRVHLGPAGLNMLWIIGR